MTYALRIRFGHVLIAGILTGLSGGPAYAQFTVLEPVQQAQAQPEAPAASADTPVAPVTSGPCGNQPLTIARMSWPSATILAEIHARLLTQEFGCEVRVNAGDLAATASSMGTTGQPVIAPEMWVTRIADVWNSAVESQMVRSAAPSYAQSRFEGWYMPAYAAAGLAEVPSAARLAEDLALLSPEEKLRFISCPVDWACSIFNRNLLRAYGSQDRVELIEPANRFEMDRVIGEAVSRREPFLFYYWQPNAVLAQVDVVALDMGAFDAEAAKCLADRDCGTPLPSSFPDDMVVIAVAERVFTDLPIIASYLQRASMPLSEMNAMLAKLNEANAEIEEIIDEFVATRGDIWRPWVASQGQ